MAVWDIFSKFVLELKKDHERVTFLTIYNKCPHALLLHDGELGGGSSSGGNGNPTGTGDPGDVTP